MRVDGRIRRVERDRHLAVMTVLHQILCCVGKGHIGVQIAPLLGESFDPTIGGKAVVVTGVADYQGCFVGRWVICFDYLLQVLVREVSLNALSRSLITCLENVNPFCKHRVY